MPGGEQESRQRLRQGLLDTKRKGSSLIAIIALHERMKLESAPKRKRLAIQQHPGLRVRCIGLE